MTPVRRLVPDDADRYAELRREMLQDSPLSFGASPETDRWSEAANVRAALARADYAIFGAFVGEQLVAVAGVRREDAIKRRHIAFVWGVYVTPSHRRQGFSRHVVAEAINEARRWVDIDLCQLSVSETAPHARRVYESLGFTLWGTEPDCLRMNGQSSTEHHLYLRVR